MRCEQFEELVHGLVRLELLDTDLRDQAFAHARICAGCSARLEAAQALADATEATRQATSNLQTPLHVDAALLSAFREQHRGSGEQKRASNYLVAAAAACLLIASAIGYAEWSRSFSHGKDVAQNSQGPRGAQLASGALPVLSEAGVVLPPASSDAANESDQLANFVPVPFADETTPDDPGVIVRVQVTRAALGKLGYRVEQGTGKELVNADFLVGEDGWPRAVRLAQ